MLLSSLLSCAFALGAVAVQYTEPNSGITVEGYQSSTYTFGIALPETPGSDFIGVLAGNGTGYAGVSLGGGMTNMLLIAAWPNGNSVLSSFRQVPSYSNPPVATGTYSMIPIANGTYANATHYTYTFLCKGCILEDGTTFSTSDTTAVLGWAISTKPPTSKESVSTTFVQHDSQGNYGLNTAAAKTASYDTWASYANASKSINTAQLKFRA